MKTIIKIALGLVLGAVILIAGCAALIGAGANEAQKDSDKNSITRADYKSVDKSMSKDDVVEKFGKPQSADDVDQEVPDGAKDFIKEGEEDLSCIYYNRRGELASIFQFCFDGNGKYQSKSSI